MKDPIAISGRLPAMDPGDASFAIRSLLNRVRMGKTDLP